LPRFGTAINPFSHTVMLRKRLSSGKRFWKMVVSLRVYSAAVSFAADATVGSAVELAGGVPAGGMGTHAPRRRLRLASSMKR
jgi:hypothetical protein